MAAKQRNEVLVGGFILFAVGLFVLLLFLMGTLGGLFQGATDVRVVFSDIRGLKCGDPVSFLGSKVGRVTAVAFERRRWGEEAPALFPGETGETTRVVITLHVEGRVRRYLRTDTPVEIDKNLTGNLCVLLLEGRGGALAEGKTLLRGSPGVDLATIADRVNGMLVKAEPAIDDLSRFASRIASSRGVDEALEDMAQIARRLRDGIGPLQDELRETIQEIRSILGENRSDIRSTASNLAGGTELARKVLEKVEPAVEDLRDALVELKKTGSGIAGAIEANRPGIDAIVKDASAAISNAANLTADIRRRPWRLLYQPSRGESDALDLYDAAWAYNLGASELERCLRDLSSRMATDPQGARDPEALRVAYREVEESLRRHKEAEDAFYARLKGR